MSKSSVKAILEEYTAPELKKMIRATNITGYSKLKKDELIKLMTRSENIERFTSIRKKSEREAPVSKAKVNRQFKKQVKDTGARTTFELKEAQKKIDERLKKKFPKKAKPDFLDLDKDGDKKEPMKKAAAEAKKAEPKKKVIKVKKSKNEPLSKENREIKSELQKIMNKHFGEYIKVYKKVLSGKIKYESEEEEELLRDIDDDTNDELAKVAKKYKIPKTQDSEFFESDRGFEKVTRLQALKNSKIDLTTLSNYKALTPINKKLDEKFEKEEQEKKETKKPKKKAEPKKKMPSGVHIHLDGKTMKYNSVKEGQAAFDKIRSNRAKKPYKKMTLMDGDKILDYSA